MANIISHIKLVKDISRHLAVLSDETRNAVLISLAQSLTENTDLILKANTKDLKLCDKDQPKYDRLKLTKGMIKDMAQDVLQISLMKSPLDITLFNQTMPNGLNMQKISIPLGVVAVVYESRPNVTVDVFALSFKAGNACILKGGKEAENTNLVLAKIIESALIEHHVHPEAIYLMPSERESVDAILNAVGSVDVCIPRGSKALIDFVRDNAKVPVIETGAGIVHTYFDVSGDLKKGRAIIENAKTRKVSVCNALDTLLVHVKRLDDLAKLVQPLGVKKVEIFADRESYNALVDKYPAELLKHATIDDFGREFLALKMSIKTVASCEEAVYNIMYHTSAHSEAIIAEDPEAIEYFLNNIDAAVLYVNASTSFTDGGEFGMGAEIGISTQKLHARGPMGVNELISYKWIVRGNGQIRTS